MRFNSMFKNVPVTVVYPRNRPEILCNLYPDVGKGIPQVVSCSSPPPYTNLYRGYHPLEICFPFYIQTFSFKFSICHTKFLVNKFDLLHLKRSFDFNCTLFLLMANGYNYIICFVSVEIMNQNGFLFLFWL